jgi:sulfate transport system ATP-binding protein
LHITGILVTHDQEEALEVADRVVVMHQGKIEQIGTPDEVYEKPANPFVYRFLGDVNVFHGRVSEEQTVPEGSEGASVGLSDTVEEHEVTFVRPHDLELNRSRTNPDQFEATVHYVLTAGSRVRLELIVQGSAQAIEVELTKERYRELDLREGEVVFVYPKQQQVFRIPQS